MKIGIIDLGTNTFNLLIAEIDDVGGYKQIYRSKVGVKLGEGSFAKNYITEEAMERAMVALHAQIGVVKNQYCDRILAFATAAVRNASNRKQFLDKVYSTFKIKIRVIDGEQEAGLIFQGVQMSGALTKENALIMDIGGGSTEFIVANDQEIIWKQSYELGVTRLVEKFEPNDPITVSQIEETRLHLMQTMSEVFDVVQREQVKVIIGSSGSFDSFADVLSYRKKTFEEDALQSNLAFNMEELKPFLNELVSTTISERQSMTGMAPIRANIINMSAIFVLLVLEKTNIPDVKLSRYALKEGVLFDVLKGNL